MKHLNTLVLLSLFAVPLGAATHEVRSPNDNVTVTIQTGDDLSYTVAWRGRTLVGPSPIGLTLADGERVGTEVVDVRERTADETIVPVVPEKHSSIRDHYRELSVDFSGGWGMDVRAYDDGAAYRFRTSNDGPLVVQGEDFAAAVAGDSWVYFPTEESFLTHSERVYEELKASEIAADAFASLPLLVAPVDGPKVAVTEADLRDYPGLYLRGPGLRGIFPAYPVQEERKNDRTVEVTERAPEIARTTGPRTFPWRVFTVAENDGVLIESTLVYRLAPEPRLDDTAWIRPGKVAWDWWNALNLKGVDFETGVNTATYTFFVDFAADHGIEYVILDEGWSKPEDLRSINPDVDLPFLLGHARERGVGLILWVVWKALDERLEEMLDQFAEWGVAGIKVDFMQRDDQPMVNYYWKVAEAAARRHLLVDFHGSYKPTGLRRAFPNVLTREGVRGLEWSKWAEFPTPKHNVTLPFIRMLAGPMDYTPGAMWNAHERQFRAVFDRPMSMTTRAQQMAMYVVFESPLQMLADAPTSYLREKECLDFIVEVPTVWDETRVLSAAVGEHVLLARRRGETWYAAAMTDDARALDIDLSFLGDGEWTMTSFADGRNAARDANDYRRREAVVAAGETVGIWLVKGGGWVARLERR